MCDTCPSARCSDPAWHPVSWRYSVKQARRPPLLPPGRAGGPPCCHLRKPPPRHAARPQSDGCHAGWLAAPRGRGGGDAVAAGRVPFRSPLPPWAEISPAVRRRRCRAGRQRRARLFWQMATAISSRAALKDWSRSRPSSPLPGIPHIAPSRRPSRPRHEALGWRCRAGCVGPPRGQRRQLAERGRPKQQPIDALQQPQQAARALPDERRAVRKGHNENDE